MSKSEFSTRFRFVFAFLYGIKCSRCGCDGLLSTEMDLDIASYLPALLLDPMRLCAPGDGVGDGLDE